MLLNMAEKVLLAALSISAGMPSGPGAALAESMSMHSMTNGWVEQTSTQGVIILPCCWFICSGSNPSAKKSSGTLNSSIGVLATDSYCFLRISLFSKGSSVRSPFSFTKVAISPLFLENFFQLVRFAK